MAERRKWLGQGSIRKQLIDRLCPIFANIDEQFAELRSAIGTKEKSGDK